MKQIITLCVASLMITSVQAKPFNIATNLAAPLSLSASYQLAPNLELGGTYTYANLNKDETWEVNNTKESVPMTDKRQAYGLFMQFSPNNARRSGPFLLVDATSENRQFDTLEDFTQSLLLSENYFTCTHTTEAISSKLMLGFQWHLKNGLNTAIATGYRHNWHQNVNTRCNKQDAYTQTYYQKKNTVAGSAQLAVNIGFAF